jgi:hypothetical protein
VSYNETCTQDCFSRPLPLALAVFAQCLIPQCQCASLAIKPNSTELASNVSQVAAITLTLPTNYSLVRDCDLRCHDDCLSLKKLVPVSVIQQCAATRCNCFYSLDRPIREQLNVTEEAAATNITESAAIPEPVNTTVTEDLSSGNETVVNQELSPQIVNDAVETPSNTAQAPSTSEMVVESIPISTQPLADRDAVPVSEAPFTLSSSGNITNETLPEA